LSYGAARQEVLLIGIHSDTASKWNMTVNIEQDVEASRNVLF
jgi:hypothetical protein